MPKSVGNLSNLQTLVVPHIVLTGGEPFLRADIVKIIEIFANKGFSLRAQTNGGSYFTDELMSACAKAGLQEISVSVDTLNEELQDYICNSKGVLKNALKTLKSAIKLLPGISIANVVGSNFNLYELPSLVEGIWLQHCNNSSFN